MCLAKSFKHERSLFAHLNRKHKFWQDFTPDTPMTRRQHFDANASQRKEVISVKEYNTDNRKALFKEIMQSSNQQMKEQRKVDFLLKNCIGQSKGVTRNVVVALNENHTIQLDNLYNAATETLNINKNQID